MSYEGATAIQKQLQILQNQIQIITEIAAVESAISNKVAIHDYAGAAALQIQKSLLQKQLSTKANSAERSEDICMLTAPQPDYKKDPASRLVEQSQVVRTSIQSAIEYSDTVQDKATEMRDALKTKVESCDYDGAAPGKSKRVADF